MISRIFVGRAGRSRKENLQRQRSHMDRMKLPAEAEDGWYNKVDCYTDFGNLPITDCQGQWYPGK